MALAADERAEKDWEDLESGGGVSVDDMDVTPSSAE